MSLPKETRSAIWPFVWAPVPTLTADLRGGPHLCLFRLCETEAAVPLTETIPNFLLLVEVIFEDADNLSQSAWME